MRQKEGKVIVVMPAYNAELTIEKTFRDIPEGSVDDIILTDDASTDNTVEIAKRLGINVLCHKQNKGYDANQKTCYDEASINFKRSVQYGVQTLYVMLKFLLQTSGFGKFKIFSNKEHE